MENLYKICLDIFDIVQFTYSLNPKRPIKIELHKDHIYVTYAWSIVWNSKKNTMEELTYDYFKNRIDEIERNIIYCHE